MRTFLDWIYRVASILAATSLASLLLVLALQIVARAAGTMVVWADDIARFLLVATSFLAMAGTFRNGVHVRVSLLVNRAGPRFGRAIEIFCLLLCVLLTAYLAYASIDQTYDSYRFDELTSGLVAFQIWVPQAIMSLGVIVFLIATVDALVGVLRGEKPVYAEQHPPEGDGVAAANDRGSDDARRYAAAE
jgi:TRAP-type C4-dicarboxylate transport system permease small subunit